MNTGDVPKFAARLVARLGDIEAFRNDPAAAATAQFGIMVVFRDDAGGDCDIDGSYDHNAKQIVCANAASPGRRRFTILHELGHALARSDAEYADWIWNFPDSGRTQDEQVANAFAAAVLLADDVVEPLLPPEGPTAFDVMQLAKAVTASREAVCVRASQRLAGPGIVALSRGQVVQFAATRGLPFGIRRGSDQGSDSFFARAQRREHHRETGVRVKFPSGGQSETLMADACTDESGYTFVVLMEHSAPWEALTPVVDGPQGVEIDCEECDRTRTTYMGPCFKCGDHPCPEHGCSCSRSKGPVARRCICGMQLPLAAPPDVELCELCG